MSMSCVPVACVREVSVISWRFGVVSVVKYRPVHNERPWTSMQVMVLSCGGPTAGEDDADAARRRAQVPRLCQ